MPCGTSSVLSTIPATMSLASHARRYDLIARRPGNHPSTFTTSGRDQTHLHPLLSGRSPPHPSKGMSAARTNGVPKGDDVIVRQDFGPLERPHTPRDDQCSSSHQGGVMGIAVEQMSLAHGTFRAPQFPLTKFRPPTLPDTLVARPELR